jgi:hypothetical protein
LIFRVDFCDDVNRVFTSKGLEKEPLKETSAPSITSLRNLSIIDPVFSEKSQRLNQILDEYNAILLQRRIFVKPAFQDYDRHNNGRFFFFL